MLLHKKTISEKQWSFPYKASLFYSKRIARNLKDKHVIVGVSYLNKSGKVYKWKDYHGTVLSVDLNLDGGVQIWEDGTAKIEKLPPELRAWRHAKKGVYRLRTTGEKVDNVDYISVWDVLPNQKLMSPVVGNEKLLRGKSGYYNIYGFGTRLIGHANKNKDGSYTATKWLTMLYFPIWPLGTYHISGRQRTITFGLGLNGTHTSAPLFLDIRQVILTYIIWLPLLALFILAIIKNI